MGSAASFQRRSLSAVDERCSPQDEAMSFRGKCGAMKTILHTDGSKIAVMKYFRQTDSEGYLNYYFEVEDLKTCSGSVFVQKVKELRDRYNPQRNPQQNEVKLDIWLNIEGAFAEEDKINEDRIGEITTLLKFSQSYVISVLTSFLDDFLASSYYLDWERGQQTAEREGIVLRRTASATSAAARSQAGSSGGSVPGTSVTANVAPTTGAGITLTPPVVMDASMFPKYKEILLADDSAVTTKITSMTLTRAGFIVTKASHGRDVLNLLASERSFGLAIIDLYMPIVDGFEAVETFRKSLRKGKSDDDKEILSAKSLATGLSCNDEVCIIGMSADENSTTRNRAFAAGVDYFLQKPFTMEKFYDILRDIQGNATPSINRAASGVVQL